MLSKLLAPFISQIDYNNLPPRVQVAWKAVQITSVWRYVPPAHLPPRILPSDGNVKRTWITMGAAIKQFLWPHHSDCHIGSGQASQPFPSYQEAEAYAHQNFGSVFGKDYFIKSVSVWMSILKFTKSCPRWHIRKLDDISNPSILLMDSKMK